MTYTNIASAYTTAGDPNAKYNFNKHSWTLFNRDNPHFSKKQFKVAIQQLQQAGVLDSSRGYANEKLKADVLRGTPGMGAPGSPNPKNPMGQFQGTGGNFGLKSYTAAKDAGYAPQEIYSGALMGDMFLPEGAMAQYMKDITPLPLEPKEIPLPGTQTGAHNVNNYSALGIRSPRPEGWDLNTGGTTAAFGRPKKPKNTVNALSINPVTL